MPEGSESGRNRAIILRNGSKKMKGFKLGIWDELENTLDMVGKESGEDHLPAVVLLNVGGHHFVTKLSTLTKDKESMLAAMFSGRHQVEKDGEGRYFIDRDGTYFKHILNFLRDGIELPLPSVATQVYKEAQFYQIQGLIKRLEKYSNVFAMKLEKAKKAKFGDHFDEWKETIITCAQTKSIENLSSTVKLSLLTSEDHTRLMEENECMDRHDHRLVVYTPGPSSHHECFEYTQKRLKEPDLITSDVTDDDMKLFVKIIERELVNDGYRCSLWEEVIRCKNIKMHYGIGKENCHFCVTEHVVEFEWSQLTS